MKPPSTCRPPPAAARRAAAGPLALALALLWGSAWGPTYAEPAPWRNWRTLQMKVRSGLFRGQVEMRLSDGPTGRRLDVQTVGRLLGKTVGRSSAVTTFGPDGRVLDYTSSSKKRGRRFHFEEHGYTVEKIRPRGDASAPLSAWEVTSRTEFAYPKDTPGPPGTLQDYYGMLLNLHAHKLAVPGDEVSLLVATSKGPRRYRVSVREQRTMARQFTDLATGKPTTVLLPELRLSIVPEDPANNEGFLSMEGETELWVESESKTLIEIGGKMPNVGRVKLTLSAIG